MPVLERDHPNGIKRGHIWTYLGDTNRHAFCDYTPSWEGEHPLAVLGEFRGECVQGDGYAGINSFFNKPNAPKRAGCVDHARRCSSLLRGGLSSSDAPAGSALPRRGCDLALPLSHPACP